MPSKKKADPDVLRIGTRASELALRQARLVENALLAHGIASELVTFRKLDAAQLCGADIKITHPTTRRRLDYIFADYGWRVAETHAVADGVSDHYPLVAELFWSRS